LEGTWHLLRQTYGIEHIFLPSYSPFLNPIEYAFNDLKAAVKQQVFYNRGELLRTIEEEIKNITAEKS
jgi:transposase